MSIAHTKPALSALIILAHYHGIAVNPADIQHQFANSTNDLNETEWLLAAKSLELKAKVVQQSIKRLHLTTLPALVWCDDGNHFVLAKIDGIGERAQYLIQDLVSNKSNILSFAEFSNRYSGKLILVASRASVLGSLAKFDFTWFIPAVIKYRRLFFEVLIVSVVLQFFCAGYTFVFSSCDGQSIGTSRIFYFRCGCSSLIGCIAI